MGFDLRMAAGVDRNGLSLGPPHAGHQTRFNAYPGRICRQADGLVDDISTELGSGRQACQACQALCRSDMMSIRQKPTAERDGIFSGRQICMKCRVRAGEHARHHGLIRSTAAAATAATN